MAVSPDPSAHEKHSLRFRTIRYKIVYIFIRHPYYFRTRHLKAHGGAPKSRIMRAHEKASKKERSRSTLAPGRPGRVSLMAGGQLTSATGLSRRRDAGCSGCSRFRSRRTCWMAKAVRELGVAIEIIISCGIPAEMELPAFRVLFPGAPETAGL